MWKATPPAKEGKVGTVVFWLLIDGYPDFYLHFGMGFMKDYTLGNE